VNTIEIEIPDIPHGHGLSFKKGIADGLLDSSSHKKTCHETHKESYLRGSEVGEKLKANVAKLVKF
jgi:hypothetical protein